MASTKTTASDVVPSEHFEQRELVRWFRQTWPGVLIHAIPNGSWRSKATAGRLKAEGVVSGIPDLFVPAWRLWIEMKRVKGGSLSKEQRAIIKHLESVGYWVVVGKGADDAKRQVSAFFDQLVTHSENHRNRGVDTNAEACIMDPTTQHRAAS